MSRRVCRQAAAFSQRWYVPSRRRITKIHVDNPRYLCATQKNPGGAGAKRTVREDLYYRLNVLTLNLPPLRDCPQGYYAVDRTLFRRVLPTNRAFRELSEGLSPILSTVLTRYGWPGNVRQQMRFTGR